MPSFNILTTSNTYIQLATTVNDIIQVLGGNTTSISPSTITGNVNNYNPTSFSTATELKISQTGPLFTISGLVPSTIPVIRFWNFGSYPITLLNQNTDSSAANRFSIGADKTLLPGESVYLTYNSGSQRWITTTAYIVSIATQADISVLNTKIDNQSVLGLIL